MNFDELGKKFGQRVQDTVSEVQKMNEIRQLNSRINDEKRQIKSVLAEIGTKVYEQFKDAPLEGFDVLFEEIEECEAAIADYEQQILDIRKVRVCPNCKAEVSLTGKFCSACGAELPEIVVEEPEETAEDVANDIADDIEEAAEDVANDIADDIEEAAEEVADEAAEAAKEVTKTAEETRKDLEETVEDAANAAATGISDVFEKVRSAASEAVEELKSAAGEAVDAFSKGDNE